MNRGLGAAALLIALVAVSQADVITQWNFNFGSDANTTTGTLTPSIGSGTASLIGGTTSTFAGGSSNDPETADDSAWNTTNYATTAPNKSAGVQFLASTVGYEDITFVFDLRKSNTASRFLQVQYTEDGTTWLDFGAPLDHDALNNIFRNALLVDFSTIATADNNANFGVRLVAAFNSSDVYEAALSGGTFGASGTLRYDMVTFSGTQVVPEPATMAILGMGALALLRRRKK